jgi:hypothetical protein
LDNKLKMVITFLLVIVIFASVFLVNGLFNQPKKARTFYVGVEYAYADDTVQLEALVDKVAPYTNLLS